MFLGPARRPGQRPLRCPSSPVQAALPEWGEYLAHQTRLSRGKNGSDQGLLAHNRGPGRFFGVKANPSFRRLRVALMGLFPTLTYSPPARRTAREILFAHRNHNEGHDDFFSLSSSPDSARPRSGARAAPGVAQSAPDLGSSAYAADRYACTVSMRILGMAGSSRSLVRKTGHFVRRAVASWRASGVFTACATACR